MESKMLTIDQVSQILGVSKDTVRRRIRAGELQAEKHPGPYGDQWLLPDFQFDQARIVHDVVPVTRQITITELQAAMQKVVADAVATQTAELIAKVEQLTTDMEKQKELLAANTAAQTEHYRLVDERLRQIMEAKQQAAVAQQEQPKSWWSRLFG